jgi:hypothetical protein
MEFHEISLEQAKTIARSLRMNPELQQTITENLSKLTEGNAWQINLGEAERSRRNAIKGQIERIATLQGIPVAVRTSGTDKLVCWKLSDEELRERKARGEALQAGRRKIKEEGEAAASRRKR